jgi:hypothetical protein
MRNQVAPQVGRGGIAVEKDNRLAAAGINIGDFSARHGDASAQIWVGCGNCFVTHHDAPYECVIYEVTMDISGSSRKAPAAVSLRQSSRLHEPCVIESLLRSCYRSLLLSMALGWAIGLIVVIGMVAA